MATATKYQLFSFDEFRALVPEGQKADLLDGVIHVASPDNIEHYSLNSWFDRLLADFLEFRQLGGMLFGYRVAFRISDLKGPEPDLAYVTAERLHLVRTTFVDGPPDWAIEIVSPDTIERDYYQKRKQFQQSGVREYWIIDPLKHKVTVFRLGKDGKFRAIKPRNGILESAVISGFWIRISWLWQTPLPPKSQVLAEIMGGGK